MCRKYLKAKLVEAGVAFAKAHDLQSLLKLILPVEPGWLALDPQLDALSKFAVVYRYPGNDATKEDAKQAIEDCRTVRHFIRQAFGLPT
jgi:HEPN domain-containing protein